MLKNKLIPLFILFSSTLGCATTAKEAPKEIRLGVLEYLRANGAAAVTLPFWYSNGTWKDTGESSDEHISGRIVFQGKNLQEVTIADQGRFFTLDNPKLTPKVGEPTDLFSGWTSAKVHRPLVFTTGNAFANSDGWKAEDAKAFSDKELIRLFRERTKEIVNCAKQDGDPTKSKPYKFKDSQLLATDVYKNNKGALLVSLKLDPKLYKCDGVIPDEWFNHWFYKSEDGKYQYLRRSLVLVDLADFDGDGKTEAVFFTPGYNQDGYVLYFNNFADSVETSWKYH